MGRAYGVICDSCRSRMTVMESSGRIGISPSARVDVGPTDEDATVPRVLEVDLEHWPPCPSCGAFTLHHDPNSTDMLLPDDGAVPAPTPHRRRRTDQLRAAP